MKDNPGLPDNCQACEKILHYPAQPTPLDKYGYMNGLGEINKRNLPVNPQNLKKQSFLFQPSKFGVIFFLLQHYITDNYIIAHQCTLPFNVCQEKARINVLV